ncbi:uncharacterized protein LOC103699136 [Phoenix dactylifera]|uniref:Mitochondrial import inner membrane translocase subunit TIM50 n=1 Tax=Phoenix dactylifera TaxID=42345 RepID=A0A8B9ACJ7_PHODC|nr:uncharacterized protein LOC103699136 [Phoenix dactylifera]
MGNRKIPSSGTQLGREKRKRRTEKHSLPVANRVEAMEERNRGKISDEKNDVKSTNLKSTDSDTLKKSNLNESKPANSRKRRRHRKRGKIRPSDSGSMVCSSFLAAQSGTSAKRSFLPGIVGKGHRLKNFSIRTAIGDTKGSSEEKENSALIIDAHVDLTKSKMHTGISSNLGTVKNTQSNKRRKAERGKQKVFSLSQYRTGLDREKYSALRSSKSDIAQREVVGKNNINASENVKPADRKDYVSNVMPLCNHRDATRYQDGREVPSLSVNHAVEHCISVDLTRNQDKKLDALHVSPGRSLISCTKKKLLVLDLNGVLADAVLDYRKTLNADKRIDKQAVFKRPFCDNFLNFCFEKFDIGIWSSKLRKNVDAMVDYLMGDAKHRLLFCWDRSKCTLTGFSTVENVEKPLVLKEMKKLWNKEDPDLPWESGEYLPSNTLLVDDSPYKALCNPPHTAIFPYPYHFYDEGDNSIGPGGDIRVYLEGLAMADNVQHYVFAHPFGQRAITGANPSWKFYQQIIDKFGNYSSPT